MKASLSLALLAAVLASYLLPSPSASAGPPRGWVYGLVAGDSSSNGIFLYEYGAARWLFVSPDGQECAYNTNTGRWWKLNKTLLRDGFSYWDWPYAFHWPNQRWYYIAPESAPQVYDYSANQWVKLGTVASTPGLTITQQEQQVHSHVNSYRSNLGRGALQRRTNLDTIARAHSQAGANGSISRAAFIDHSGFDNRWTQVRQTVAASGMAENVGYVGGSTADPALSQFTGWRNSTGHNNNMLDNRMTLTGVGVARAGDGTWFFTQIFVRTN